MARRPIAALCLFSILAQTLAPAIVHADGNPFSRVPGPVIPATPVAPPPTVFPVSPDPLEEGGQCSLNGGGLFSPGLGANTQLCLPQLKPREVCEAPRAQASADFKRLVRDYIRAYEQDDMKWIHIMSKIAVQVFENPGSADYIQMLKYLDEQAIYAPEAMYDIGKALQNRWEAAYGMHLSQKLQAGIADQNAEATLGEQRNERRAQGRRAGGIIGGLVAMTALGILALRNPAAVPRYNAVFRALVPLKRLASPTVITGLGIGSGIVAGRKVADYLSASYEKDLPMAPAHVMHLGIDNDALLQDEDMLEKMVAPILAGIIAGEGVSLLLARKGMIKNLLGVVRTVSAVNKAAPVKLNLVSLVASVAVSIVVEGLVGEGIKRWEYRKLKKAVTASRDGIDLALKYGDTVLAYRAADAMVANTLVLAAYSNRPIMEANAQFLKGLGEASEKFKDEEDPEYKKVLDDLVGKLTNDVNSALNTLDQRSDADYQAYLALDVLEVSDPTAIEFLSQNARTQLQTYLSFYHASSNGIAEVNSAASQERFHRYIRGMRAAKNRELTQQMRRGEFVRHSGHTMLMASAFLRSTGMEYVQPQADFLMAEVAREEAMIHALTTPQTPGIPGRQRL